MKRQVLKISTIVVALVFVGSLLLLWQVLAEEKEPVSDNTIVYRGSAVEPPLRLTDFSLPASTGETLSLSDLQGQWVLLFFGFTHCPDFCPTTLAGFRQMMGLLGDDPVQVLLVSVDGERDTPEILARYLAQFHESFIGMSGDDETLTTIQEQFGLFYQRFPREGSDNYTVDHTTRSYLIDPQGYLRMTYAYGTEPEILADTIREMIYND